MAGYYDMSEATVGAIDDEGWYHKGDLASMDARGFLRIDGTVKDMIIRVHRPLVVAFRDARRRRISR